MRAFFRFVDHKTLNALILGAAILLAGGSRDHAFGEPGNTPPQGLTICIGGAPGIPAVVASELGLFAKTGLSVTLKKHTAGSQAFAAMLDGKCDLSMAGETPVVMNSFERRDFSILATLASSDDSTRILANRARGIQKPEDLKGKRIFVHKGSTNHFFLDMFLLKKGLLTKNANLIFKDVADVPEAFSQGDIDAYAATDALISKPRQTLGENAVVFSSPGLCLISFNLVAMNSVVKEKPQAIKSMLSALLQAEEVIDKDRPQAIKTVALAMSMTEEDTAVALSPYRWDVVLEQTLLLSLEQEAQWAIASGLTGQTRIPNYLDYVERGPLLQIKPAAVSMLQ